MLLLLSVYNGYNLIIKNIKNKKWFIRLAQRLRPLLEGEIVGKYAKKRKFL